MERSVWPHVFVIGIIFWQTKSLCKAELGIILTKGWPFLSSYGDFWVNYLASFSSAIWLIVQIMHSDCCLDRT